MVIEVELIVKLLLSAGLGMLIGLEREIHKKPAGLRTHALVSLGVCLFTIIGSGLIGDSESLSRVLQGIITGLGFLGAGIIFQARDRVRGLTTATEIWTLAAIGILVGLGDYTLAITATVLILVILVPFKWFEKGIEK